MRDSPRWPIHINKIPKKEIRSLESNINCFQVLYSRKKLQYRYCFTHTHCGGHRYFEDATNWHLRWCGSKVTQLTTHVLAVIVWIQIFKFCRSIALKTVRTPQFWPFWNRAIWISIRNFKYADLLRTKPEEKVAQEYNNNGVYQCINSSWHNTVENRMLELCGNNQESVKSALLGWSSLSSLNARDENSWICKQFRSGWDSSSWAT